ncbi:MAG: histidine phosphatase family protein [Deltaproteobacteria bacterium]|nr:histidine phosphatase family protein [Deltaproteobacteria bacterium]
MSSSEMTTFLLVRHGESEANVAAVFGSQQDTPLSALGRAQTAALAAAMLKTTIHAVYSSDLSRARDTVSPMAVSRAISLVELAEFRERAVGVLTGKSFDVIREEHPTWWKGLTTRDPDFAPPGGESLRALQARVAGALEPLHSEHAGKSVLIGAHGGTINAMVRHLLGLHDMRTQFVINIANASVTRIDVTTREGARHARLAYCNRVAFSDESFQVF